MNVGYRYDHETCMTKVDQTLWYPTTTSWGGGQMCEICGQEATYIQSFVFDPKAVLEYRRNQYERRTQEFLKAVEELVESERVCAGMQEGP